VCLDYRLGGGHGFGVAIPIDRVGFGQSFLTAGDRVDAVIDGCDRTNRHASAVPLEVADHCPRGRRWSRAGTSLASISRVT